MYLQPTVKLGVKHGDSSRMKFPAQEYQDSDLRLKKVKVSPFFFCLFFLFLLLSFLPHFGDSSRTKFRITFSPFLFSPFLAIPRA